MNSHSCCLFCVIFRNIAYYCCSLPKVPESLKFAQRKDCAVSELQKASRLFKRLWV